MTDKNQSTPVAAKNPKTAPASTSSVKVSAPGVDINDPAILQESVNSIMKNVIDAVSELRKLVQLGELLRPWASAVSNAPESSGESQQVGDNPSISNNQITLSATNPDPIAPIQSTTTNPTIIKPVTMESTTTKLTPNKTTASQPATTELTTTGNLAATERVNPELAEMRNANIRLQEDLKNSQQQTSLLKKQLAEEGEKLRKETENNYSLRDVITKGSDKPKLLEQDVTAKFRRLRTTIEIISKSQELIYLKKNIAADIFKPTDPKGPELKDDDQRKRLRSKIFEIIHFNILRHPCFGLDGYRTDVNSPDFELAFNYFEDALIKASKDDSVSSSLMTDWRIATLACVEALKVQSTKPSAVASEIMDFLGPFMIMRKTKVTTPLHKKVLELCQDTLDFALTVRRSDGDYWCFLPKVDMDFSKNEHVLEGLSIEGNRETDNDLVAVALHGALVKTIKGNSGKNIILEKALVVLQAK